MVLDRGYLGCNGGTVVGRFREGLGFRSQSLPIVYQNLYYRILTIKLVNQKEELQWRL